MVFVIDGQQFDCDICSFLYRCLPNAARELTCFKCNRTFNCSIIEEDGSKVMLHSRKRSIELEQNRPSRLINGHKTPRLASRTVSPIPPTAPVYDEDSHVNFKRPATKRQQFSNLCGGCDLPFRDIDSELQVVQCDACLKWYCGLCVPPISYTDDEPYFCYVCGKGSDSIKTAAMNRQNEEQNRLGPILTCENEWCTYTAQVDKSNGTSMKKALFLIRSHQSACKLHYSKGNRYMPNKPSTNKYVPIHKHGLGFHTIPVKGERLDDDNVSFKLLHELSLSKDANDNDASGNVEVFSDSSDDLFDESSLTPGIVS